MRPKRASNVETVRWWPLGEPLPRGWRIAPHQVLSHHHAYCVLIVRIG